MNEHLQTLVIMASIVTAMSAVATACVGALCFFLRRLVATVEHLHLILLPKMLNDFREEAKEGRDACHIEHLASQALVRETHQELMKTILQRET